MRGVLLICTLLLAVQAAAQTRGSVRIVGHVSKTASLQFHSASVFGVRANAAYALTVTVVAPEFSPGAGQVQLSDAGFGIPRVELVASGGALRSPDNALLVSTQYSLLPQDFEPNAGFSAVVIYTLATP